MSVPAAYLAVIVVWTTTPLGIKISNQTIPFLAGATLRMVLGAVLIWLLLVSLRQSLPMHSKARWSYLAGSISIYAGMLITYWSAQFIPSGLIAVVYGLAPIASAIQARFITGERGLTPLRIISFFFGVLGLSMIFSSEIQVNPESYKGLLGVATAAIIFPLGGILVQRIKADVSALQQTTGTLSVSAIWYVLSCLVVGQGLPAEASVESLSAVVYLAVFGSVLGFLFYFYLLQKISAARLALIPVITPVLAVLLGVVFAGEQFSADTLVGAMLILMALLFFEAERFLPRRSRICRITG